MNPLDKVFRGYYGSGVEKSSTGEPNIKVVDHEVLSKVFVKILSKIRSLLGNFRLGPAATRRQNGNFVPW